MESSRLGPGPKTQKIKVTKTEVQCWARESYFATYKNQNLGKKIGKMIKGTTGVGRGWVRVGGGGPPHPASISRHPPQWLQKP